LEKLVRFGVAVPDNLLSEFDRCLKDRGIPNRSEAIRQLLREFIAEELWDKETGTVYGAITITYDHHSHDTMGELTALQHDFGDVINCSTHVHIDHDHCLEVIVVSGNARTIKNLVDSLSSTRGIETVSPRITTIL
jgi:CopG family nickel-responsive transcriptional regulator